MPGRSGAPKLGALTPLSLHAAPEVCHGCVWWQTRSPRREVEKAKWMERFEEEIGSFGTLYYADDGDRAVGLIQYGPAPFFPRAYELPSGPPSDDSLLVTCAYVVDASTPWVLQSLVLAAIAEGRERGAPSIEAFAYRYPEGEGPNERFRVHRTVFPADFLEDFGFLVAQSAGRVGLARLELGGLEPVVEGRRERVLRVVKDAFIPGPLPERS